MSSRPISHSPSDSSAAPKFYPQPSNPSQGPPDQLKEESVVQHPAAPSVVEATVNSAVFFGMPQPGKLCPEQPDGIQKTNVVEQIAKSLNSGDKKHQDKILEWIYDHPAEAEDVAQLADVRLVAGDDPWLAKHIRHILHMKKSSV
ncbi:hypothetical protein M3Y99_01881400 [Aphelenchoides fujianensis]|nr:hypothetical protein M3Y99_01881400 [Aphelenchoides fujianensis]